MGPWTKNLVVMIKQQQGVESKQSRTSGGGVQHVPHEHIMHA